MKVGELSEIPQKGVERKRGEGKDFQKEGASSVKRGGYPKKGGWNPLLNYAICTIYIMCQVCNGVMCNC